ncbi:relaxase/mobilization nuclease domain-containing protein [Bacteroides xylanisolvens]|nr:relaxase/mobilization nuclease domain-containing protein [Bacteroides xylanisolvens]MCA4464652.1 relaxase/mobilization nuclease domain-containing protein [Bacteroides xylanisolvens]MCA4469126.1 relaxase/mobilization nuclease domain-containing protein [Bacteroides xylanisolvens]MCA4478390.1 relaxase/mobilization nuclease domain-containing protein [Bacteroides xylanisolvens]MCA4487631.1 relaxase/mobilization nuclease domain-containing protein [Bacteroides xylanisolvens]MCA4491891.1 relaxase/m
MFAKITTGTVVQGLIDYMDNVNEKDAKILLAKDMLTTSHEAICASFKVRAAMNNKVTDKVCHISLSFSAKDKNRTQSDEFITAFAEDYLRRMGWENSQHIIIRHCDHDYDHVHIAMNVIDQNGDALDMGFYKDRSKSVCYSMTKEYGLYFAPKSKKDVNQKALKGKEKLKYEIASKALPLLDKCKTLDEFRKALLEKGILTTITTRKDGNGYGIVYTLIDRNFSIGGKKCDDALSFSSLAKRLDMEEGFIVHFPDFGSLPRTEEHRLNLIAENYGIKSANGSLIAEITSILKPSTGDLHEEEHQSEAINNAEASQEDSTLLQNLAAATMELATGGTQIAPSSGGGGGGEDNWWERERQRAKQEEYVPKRKGRR